jgi:hypothetical protein
VFAHQLAAGRLRLHPHQVPNMLVITWCGVVWRCRAHTCVLQVCSWVVSTLPEVRSLHAIVKMIMFTAVVCWRQARNCVLQGCRLVAGDARSCVHPGATKQHTCSRLRKDRGVVGYDIGIWCVFVVWSYWPSSSHLLSRHEQATHTASCWLHQLCVAVPVSVVMV